MQKAVHENQEAAKTHGAANRPRCGGNWSPAGNSSLKQTALKEQQNKHRLLVYHGYQRFLKIAGLIHAAQQQVGTAAAEQPNLGSKDAGIKH